ncbi:ornithine aminotransferase car2 [Aspergillus lentulus]|nr:ornithine aminotransferase car2 [Aspergillus lentulus]
MALESSRTFLDILQGLKPRLSPTSSTDSECSYSDYWDDAEFVAIVEEPPCNPTPTILNPEDLTEPTTLTILTCYTWLLQAYDTIFSQIYSALAIRTDITSPSSIPSVLPGLQFGGFDLDEHRDMQIETPI